MTILAFEFSSEQRSVACARDGVVLAEACATGGRATQAMSLIETVLKQSGVSNDEIDHLVVGLGPGSYTGIRTAIAVVQGWHLVKEVKCAGISSVQALAAQARAEKLFGPIDFVIDAQRGEVYHSQWNVAPAEIKELTPLKILSAAQLEAVFSKEKKVAGPEATRWHPAGRILFPTATALCELAGREKTEFGTAHLEPIYLRETSFIKAPPSRSY